MRRFVWLTFVPALAVAGSAKDVIETQVATQKYSANIQKRIDALDDETRRLVAEYQARLTELKELTRYNAQLEKLVADQQQEIALRQKQLAELEVLKRKLFPFLLEMLTALEKIVEVDTPFLPEERRRRVKGLRELMNRADVALPEKYRRLMEAFRIEARYGHNIETYEGSLPKDGGRRTVHFLRFGRVGLYYLTLDGQEGGVWDAVKQNWRRLNRESLRPLEHAMRIAAKQAPPDLVVLPVPAPEVP